MAYIATSDVREYSGFPASDTADCDLISNLITRATGIIELYTDRVFEAASDTRYYDAIEDVDGQYLYLDKDLAVITTITNGNGVVITSDNYVTEPRNDTPIFAIRLLDSSSDDWTYATDSQNAISVLGDWGYSAAPPAEIKHACIRLVMWMYKQRNTDEAADRPIVFESGVTVMPPRLPADVVAVLDRYKRSNWAAV